MIAPVLGAQRWASNADLIADVARLGYLHADWLTLDPTYGEGVFWRKFRPARLVTCDLVPKLASTTADFRALPFADGTFDTVVYDPPYKLNGTPTKAVDERYGVDVVMRWQDRMQLMRAGLIECARVLRPRGFLLAKCQNQVCSGQVRWQTDMLTEAAHDCDLTKVDVFEYIGTARPQTQPRQQHARRNHSTLLVFSKGGAA